MLSKQILLLSIWLCVFVVHTTADERNNRLLNIPLTSFKCENHEWPGYYADTEANCQVFHICVHRPQRIDQFSFLCPNGTAFDQQLLVCTWEASVDCSITNDFYHINGRIYQYDVTNDFQNTQGSTSGRTDVFPESLPPVASVEDTGNFEEFDSIVSLRTRNPNNRQNIETNLKAEEAKPADIIGSSKSIGSSPSNTFSSISDNRISGVDLKNTIPVIKEDKSSNVGRPLTIPSRPQQQRPTPRQNTRPFATPGRPLPAAPNTIQPNTNINNNKQPSSTIGRPLSVPRQSTSSDSKRKINSVISTNKNPFDNSLSRPAQSRGKPLPIPSRPLAVNINTNRGNTILSTPDNPQNKQLPTFGRPLSTPTRSLPANNFNRNTGNIIPSTSNNQRAQSFGRPLPNPSISQSPRGNQQRTRDSKHFNLNTSRNQISKNVAQTSSIGRPLTPVIQPHQHKPSTSNKIPSGTHNGIPSTVGRPLPSLNQAAALPAENIQKVKLNIPSSRPLSAEIVPVNTQPSQVLRNSIPQKKTSVLFIDSADAEQNPDKQQKVFVNTIKLPDNGIERSENSRTNQGSGSLRNRQSNDFGRPLPIPQSQPEIKHSTQNNKQEGGVPLGLERFAPSSSGRSSGTQQSGIDTGHRFSFTSHDNSLESGNLGLIASSIFKLPPPA